MAKIADNRVEAEEVCAALALDRKSGQLIWRERQDMPRAWNAKHIGKVAGWVCKRTGRISIKFKSSSTNKQVSLLAHRVVWLLEHGSWPTSLLDHRNSNQNCNLPVNLRLANESQNGANVRKVRSKTGFKGAYNCSQTGRFLARICKDRKQIHLGRHDTAEQAAKAYDSAAIRLFGEFAVTNEMLGLVGCRIEPSPFEQIVNQMLTFP
jgi:hypothetical protein